MALSRSRRWRKRGQASHSQFRLTIGCQWRRLVRRTSWGGPRHDDRQKPMKLTRRKFQHLAAGALGLSAVSRSTLAQAYPAQPVRLVVGFAAGQAIDILARLIAQSLSEQFAQQFIVENRPGAGGN